jgi:type IV secretory pathway VirB2 component (pilin)
MRVSKTAKMLALLVAAGIPFFVAHPAFAASTDGAAQASNFIKNLTNVLASLGGGIATLALVWGGIMYMSSSGNLQNLDKAKAIIKYAAIGLIIVIAAAAIVNFVSGQANSSFGG